ncbi:MAG: hypothetical protein JWO42_3762 [Chloroflexi bacterium]|nr:hypothetical protein [Chloroflexota bacterium]
MRNSSGPKVLSQKRPFVRHCRFQQQGSGAAVQDALSHGQEVQFPGFDTFYTRQRPEG